MLRPGTEILFRNLIRSLLLLLLFLREREREREREILLLVLASVLTLTISISSPALSLDYPTVKLIYRLITALFIAALPFPFRGSLVLLRIVSALPSTRGRNERRVASGESRIVSSATA